MNIGIICEYNPFHYGHLLHLTKIKELYPEANVILVMSGWICERGDLSLIDKFKKTDIALNYGIDLVVDLPFKYEQSADYFAKGSISILNKLGVDKIVFGSESCDIDLLTKLAKVQINNKKFDSLVKSYTKKGFNYPTSVSLSIKDLTDIKVDTPNDLLGISYIKEIISNNYNIEPVCIKRTNNYNSILPTGKISSATSIRELIKKNKSVRKYIPKYSYKNLSNCIFFEDYYDLLKYKIISSNNLTIYQGVDSELENRINKYILSSKSLDELINNIKSKKYTYNRLKRTLLYILLSITKEDCSNLELEYIRVLGFNSKGKTILNNIKKNIDIPILTKYDPKYLSKDLNITEILSLNNIINDKKSFIEKEYKNRIIMK